MELISTDRPHSLIMKNISISFGEKKVISDFSYTFESPGIYALSGESGAGKTTLLRIIAGLEKGYSGKLSGNDFCSYAFQEYRLFTRLSALENVMISKNRAKSREQATNLLKSLGFTDNEMILCPDELSGGMKQRVSLARAFFSNHHILLLDEPTKELDSDLCRRVNDIIKTEAKRRIVIVVSHREDDFHELNAEIIDIPKLA